MRICAACDRLCEGVGAYCPQHSDLRQPTRSNPLTTTPALDRLAELLTDPEAEPAWGRPIAAALVELADMLRARRPQ